MSFPRLRAAAVDGRAHNVKWRQQQLRSLFDGLTKSTESLTRAIAADSGCSWQEAQFEAAFTISEIKQRYQCLHLPTAMQEEYLIAHGENMPDRKEGYGIVFIEPSTACNPLYSIVSPLGAALEAGNCVVLQLLHTLGALDTILKSILISALDHDAFDVTSQEASVEDKVDDSCCFVLQNADGRDHAEVRLNELISFQHDITAALVDRHADLGKAAKALLSARLAFGGKSTYAPDIVIVNEFVKKAFLQALVQELIHLAPAVGFESSTGSKTTKLGSFIDDLKAKYDVSVVAQERHGAIVSSNDRRKVLFKDKVDQPCLVICSAKSLDDMIDFVNNISGPKLACYYFSTPEACKYLDQFIQARVSFSNFVPASILVGPAFPFGRNIDPMMKYPAELFKRPRPAFISESSTSRELSVAFHETSIAGNSPGLRLLYNAAKAPFQQSLYRRGPKMTFGFFEQAILFRLGFLALSTASAISLAALGLRHYLKHQ